MRTLRALERKSIEHFLIANNDKLRGRVLDIGCGQQPYRSLVESFGGEYIGFDRANHAGSVVSEDVGEWWDIVDDVETVMMTQVWQYIPPLVLVSMLSRIASADYPLKAGGWFLATGPTNWPLVEETDLHRFTVKGVESFLDATGFREIEAAERSFLMVEGERWPTGWQVVAKARS